MVREPKESNMRGPVLMSVPVTAMVIAASAALQAAAVATATSGAIPRRPPSLGFLQELPEAGDLLRVHLLVL